MLTRRDLSEGSRNVGTMYGFSSVHDRSGTDPVLRQPLRARTIFLEDQKLRQSASRGDSDPPLSACASAPASRVRPRHRVPRNFFRPATPASGFRRSAPSRRSSPASASARAHDPSSVAVERDIARSTVSLGAFRQEVDDQLITLFGADLPSQPTAKIGHYVVGNAGDVSAIGCTAGVRTVVASRVRVLSPTRSRRLR